MTTCCECRFSANMCICGKVEYRAYPSCSRWDEPTEAEYHSSHPTLKAAKAAVAGARRGGVAHIYAPGLRRLWTADDGSTWRERDTSKWDAASRDGGTDADGAGEAAVASYDDGVDYGLAEGARLVREYATSDSRGDLEALATLILNQSAPDCAGIEKHWDGTR